MHKTMLWFLSHAGAGVTFWANERQYLLSGFRCALQFDVGRQTTGACVAQAKHATHALNGFLDNRQPQPGAVGRCARGLAPVKRFGQIGQLFL
jgi:hypothetical protein